MKQYLCKCHDERANHARATNAPGASLGTWSCLITGKKTKVYRGNRPPESKPESEPDSKETIQ